MELICAECKNKWMPSNRINEVICPYCGNIIGELSRDFSSFEDGIAYIRNMLTVQKGMEIMMGSTKTIVQ